MTFPAPSQCGPGQLDVAPAMANKSQILSALATPPPSAGNWTPMAQTLSAAAVEPSLVTAQGTKHVILVTDGWQWCSPYDPATRYDGTDAVAALEAKGVTTWIVGFGAEVDAAALNQMAVVAGTAKPELQRPERRPGQPEQLLLPGRQRDPARRRAHRRSPARSSPPSCATASTTTATARSTRTSRATAPTAAAPAPRPAPRAPGPVAPPPPSPPRSATATTTTAMARSTKKTPRSAAAATSATPASASPAATRPAKRCAPAARARPTPPRAAPPSRSPSASSS